MSIVTRALRSLRAGLKALTIAWGSRGGWNFWGLGSLGRTQYDYAGQVGDGRGNAIVVACLQWIARTFPEAPVQVLRRDAQGAETEIAGHAMIQRIERPNRYYSGELLWRATLADLVSAGNAYWLKLRNRYGAIVELWWLPQILVEPRWPIDGSEYISHYEYLANGQIITIAPGDIVHFRDGLDPNNTRKGLSPLASLAREIFTDDEAANWSASLLKNMGVPGVIIVPGDGETTVTPEDAKAIKRDFADKFGGDHKGEPMVLSAKAAIQVVSFNPQQMDLKTLRRLPEERVSAVLGTPAVVVGLGAGLDRSTFANFSEAREAAYESNIIPTQRLLGAELKVQLLPDFEPDPDVSAFRVGFDLTNVRILQEDQDRLWTRVDTAVRGGWLTVKRAKELVGETPEPGDDIYLRPISAVETGPDAPEPEPMPESLARGQGEPDDRPEADDDQQLPKGRHVAETKATRAEQRMILALRRQADRLASRFAGELDGAFEAVADECEVTVHGPGDRGGKAAALPDDSPADFEILSITLSDGHIVRVRVPKDVDTRLFRELYKAHYRLTLETTIGLISDRLGIDVGARLSDAHAQALISGWATRKGLADISQQTRDAVMQALADGRDAGEGAEQLARRIRGYVEGRQMYPGVFQAYYDRAKARGWGDEAAERAGDRAARMYRSETIARTETKTAQNWSTVEAYEKSDVVESLLVFDGDDCGWTSHDDPDKANGKVVSFEEARQYPLAHPRCVRNFAPRVRGG